MPKTFWEIAANNIDDIVFPFNKVPEMGLLIDISSSTLQDTTMNSSGEIQLNSNLEKVLTQAFEKNLIYDAIYVRMN